MPRTPFTSPRRLYTDATKQSILEEGDARAAYLLVNEGCVPDEALFSHLDVEAYCTASAVPTETADEPVTTAPKSRRKKADEAADPAPTENEPQS